MRTIKIRNTLTTEAVSKLLLPQWKNTRASPLTRRVGEPRFRLDEVAEYDEAYHLADILRDA